MLKAVEHHHISRLMKRRGQLFVPHLKSWKSPRQAEEQMCVTGGIVRECYNKVQSLSLLLTRIFLLRNTQSEVKWFGRTYDRIFCMSGSNALSCMKTYTRYLILLQSPTSKYVTHLPRPLPLYISISIKQMEASTWKPHTTRLQTS